MAKKYGVASDYIKYTSRIKSDTSDGVAVEASQVVDLEEDKLQSEINKELKASIASASGKTYSKSEIDSKDTATLTSAKSYADTKKTEAVSAAATDAATKANAALASAKSYADQKVSALGSVYTTKGSCTAAQLKALTSAKAGDVWNITDAISIDGKAYPAGVNVVCVTAFSAAIDPAATKNWDALQGLQDLTSYAKKSEIEDTAVANVKFAQEEDVPQDNGVSFKKIITYVNGREATTESDFNLLPATSTKAGVMSAADKVKLDAVDGKIGDVKIVKEDVGHGEGYRFSKLNGENIAIIRPGVQIFGKVNIGTNTSIGEGAKIGVADIKNDVHIGYRVHIEDDAYISKVGSDADVEIRFGTKTEDNCIQFCKALRIGSDIPFAGSTSDTNFVGVTIGTDKSLGIGSDGNFIWGVNGSKKTAATTDDLSALATRVSALEDLLKLA